MGGGGESYEFKLGSLNQLRNKAFGGSQVSLNSSREGSPRSERAVMHPERFESPSPMPWDVHRASPHHATGPIFSPAHERKTTTLNTFDTGSPSITGFPPQPLTSPPPIPQSACPPVQDGAESPGDRTSKHMPVLSDAELSPAGTFGTGAETMSPTSFAMAAESPSLFKAVERSEVRNTVAFGVNDVIFEPHGVKDFADGTDDRVVDDAQRNLLLKGPCFADDAAVSLATRYGGIVRAE